MNGIENIQIQLTEFSDLITHCTADFIGREWLVKQVDALLDDPDCRFIVLTGGPGVGKTAFLAHLAATHPQWLRYFIRRDSKDLLRPGDANTFLLTIGRQLATLYPHLFRPENLEVVVRQRIGSVDAGGDAIAARIKELWASPFCQVVPHVDVEQEIGRVTGKATTLEIDRWVNEPRLFQMQDLQYLGLLDPARLLAQEQPDARIVVLVDALDELRYSTARKREEEADILRVLRELPEVPPNLRFVISSRPEAFLGRLLARSDARELRIDVAGTNNQADLRTYAEGVLAGDGLGPVLAGEGLSPEVFLEKLLDKAAGNFLYLKSVLDGIREASIDPAKQDRLYGLLRVEELPGSLTALYGYFLSSIVDWIRRHGFGDAAWMNYLSPLLGVLAVARQPLSEGQIVAFTGLRRVDVWELLRELRQFVEAVGGRPMTYRIYHTSLAEYLLDGEGNQDYWSDGQEVHGRIADRYLHAWGGLETVLVGPQEPGNLDLDGGYGLRHLAAHLEGAGRHEELRALVCKKWAKIKFERECSYAGFLSDLQLAWRVAEQQGSEGMGDQVRYAFVQSSVLSQPIIRTDLLLALLKRGVWTVKQGLNYASSIPDVRQRAEALACVAAGLGNLGPSEEADDTKERAWEVIDMLRAGTSGEDAAFALFALLPCLSGEYLSRALEVVRSFEKPWVRAELFIHLLSCLPEEQQDLLLQEVLEAVHQVNPVSEVMMASPVPAVAAWPLSTAEWIARLVIDLPRKGSSEFLSRILSESQQGESPESHIEALGERIPLLPRDQVPGLIERMLSMARESHKDCVIAQTAIKYALPWLTLEGRDAPGIARQCLQAIREIRNTRIRRPILLIGAIGINVVLPLSRALSSLARRLGGACYEIAIPSSVSMKGSGRLRRGVLCVRRRIALVAVDISWKLAMRFALAYRRVAIVKQANQVLLLLRLFDAVSASDSKLVVLKDLVTAVQEIEDPGTRAVILARLLPHLPLEMLDEIPSEVVEATTRVSDPYQRAQVIVEILPCISGVIHDGLLPPLSDPYIRAKVLAQLIPYCKDTERSAICERVLQAVGEIGVGEDYYRADVLIELARQLCPGTERQGVLSEALPIARRIMDADVRAELLGQAATVASAENQLGLYREAATAACAIQDTARRAEALWGLAYRFPESEQLPFLTAHWQTVQALSPRGMVRSGTIIGAEPLWISSMQEAFQVRVAVFSQLPSESLRQSATEPMGLGAEYWEIEPFVPGTCRIKTDVWCGLMAHLMTHIPAEDRGMVLSEMQELVGDMSLNVQVALAPLVPVDQQAVWLDGVEKAARRAWDPQARTDALRMLAHLPRGKQQNEVLSEALAAVEQIDEGLYRALTLRWLIPLLPSRLTERALRIAKDIDSAVDRTELLIEIAQRMPEQSRGPVLDEALKTAQAIADAPPFQASMLIQLIPMLGEAKQPEVIEQALNAIFAEPMNMNMSFEFSNIQAQGKALVQVYALFGLLEWQLESGTAFQTKSAALSCGNHTYHLTSPVLEFQTKSAALSCSGVSPHRAWCSPLGQFEVKLYTKSELLSTLAPLLPPESLTQAVDMAQSIRDTRERGDALMILSDHLPDDQAMNLINQLFPLADTIQDDASRALFLLDLALRTPLDGRSATLGEVCDIALSIKNPQVRVAVMTEVALNSPPDLQQKIWRQICSEDMLLKWAQSVDEDAAAGFAPLWARMPHPVGYQLWVPALRTLSRLLRPRFLSALDTLVPVLVALGGQESASAVADAILETLKAWP